MMSVSHKRVLHFKTRRSGYIRLLVGVAFVLPVLFLSVNSYLVIEKPFVVLIIFVPLLFFIWVYADTYYTITHNRLYYRSAFIRGTVEIDKIRELVIGKMTWTGVRPATALNGVLIRYNAYDEVYISPEEDLALIEELIKINDAIIVTRINKSPQ